AKRDEDRYQSAAAMRSDIERYLSGRPVEAAAPAPETAATAVVPQVAARPAGTPPRRPEPVVLPPADEPPPPRAGLWVLLALLVIGLLVAGWFLFKDTLFPPSPERIRVPGVVGMTEKAARNAIGEAGLLVSDDVQYVNH